MDLFSGQEKLNLPFEIPEKLNASLLWDENLKVFTIKIPNAELVFSEFFFNEKISNRSLEYLQENDFFDWRSVRWRGVDDESLGRITFTNVKWKHEKINIYGKRIPLPRLTSWYGDSEKVYTYSGIRSVPNPWNKGLLYIKGEIERLAMMTFNSVLLNWYRDGEDHLSWHADDEVELGINPVIASVNFGETRDFVLRRNDDPSLKIVIPLKHGTLLIMRGETQHFWQHSVPKRKNVKGSRFNLTFRNIKIDES